MRRCIETCSNNLKDFRQKKALEHLPEVAQKLQAVNERFADAQAENLNVEVDYPLLEKLATPCRLKSQRMAGIRLPPLRGGVFRGSDVQCSGWSPGKAYPSLMAEFFPS